MYEGQAIAEALSSLACELRQNRELTRELFQLFRDNRHAATKEDLREAEARIIAAIKGSQDTDQKRLDAILKKAENLAMWIKAIAKNLAQVDASTT